MSKWIRNLWQNCRTSADELATRSRWAQRRNTETVGQARPNTIDLEARILFSAVPLDVAALENQSTDVAVIDSGNNGDAESSSIFESQAVREVIVIDGGVESIDQLLDDLANERPNAAVFILDSQSDGVQQLTDILDSYSNLDSLHIISHGEPGTIQLGNTTLSENNVAGYAGQIASWQSAFSSDADILIYGCDLAGTQSGEHFVDSLSALTGADVAASTNKTGHEDLGGDWILEYGVGVIQTEIPFSNLLQENWFSTLAPNEAPLNIAPTSGRTEVDTPLVFSSSTANELSVLDVDTGTSDLQITLEVTNGTLSLGNVLPVVISQGTGANDTLVEFSGTQSEINAALDGLVFTPDTGFYGRADLGITTDDLGTGTGTGGALQDSDGFAIYVGTEIVREDQFQVNPGSPEDPVNSNESTSDDRESHTRSVAAHDDGSYIVVWQDDARTPTKESDIFAQRFDQDGNRIGQSFQVNVFDDGDQTEASVVVDGEGNFAVIWTSDGQDGDGAGIYMRRFNADGTAIDAMDVLVNDTTQGNQTRPTIAANDAGQIVIAWQTQGANAGIYANEFTISGGLGSGEFPVRLGADATNPAIDINESGDFIIVWQENGIWRRRYGSQADAGPIQIDSNPDSTNPTVAYQNDGRFVIAWTLNATFPPFTNSNPSIIVQAFGSDGIGGSAVEHEGGLVSAFARELSLESDHQGNFVLAWRRTVVSSERISLARLSIDPTSNEVRISPIVNVSGPTPAGVDTRTPSVSLVDPQNFIVVWTQETGADSSVIARRIGTGAREAITFTTADAGDFNAGAFEFGQLLSFTNPNLSLENGAGGTTTGTPVLLSDARPFTNPDTAINAIHRVGSNIIIGEGAGAVQVQQGDLLLSLFDVTDVLGVQLESNDILLLRPTIDGEYFAMGLDIFANDFPETSRIEAFSLVERDTTIGDTTVKAGSILYVRANEGNFEQHDIWVWTPATLGASTATGTSELLISGVDIGIAEANNGIDALELIEEDTVIGNQQYDAGTILLSLGRSATIDGLVIQDEDIVSFVADTTTLESGSSSGTFALQFDGSDVGLGGGNNEDVKSLVAEGVAPVNAATNQPPTLTTSATNPTSIEQTPTDLFSSSSVDVGMSGQRIESIQLEFSGLQDGTDETLIIDGTEVSLSMPGNHITGNSFYGVEVVVMGSDTRITISRSNGFRAEDAEQLLDTLQYINHNDEPSTLARTVTIASIKNDGGTDGGGVDTSNPNIASTITVVGVNDEPSAVSTPLNPTIDSLSFVSLFSSTSINTVESTDEITLIELNVTGVTNPGTESIEYDGDILAIVNGTNTTSSGFQISTSVSGADATIQITRSGNFTVAEAELLIDGLRYQITTNMPAGNERTVQLSRIQDNGGTLNSGDDSVDLNITSTISIDTVNDSPVVSTDSLNPNYTENGTPVSVFENTSIDLVESSQFVREIVLNVDGVEDASQEFLEIGGTSYALNSGFHTAGGNQINLTVAGNLATITIQRPANTLTNVDAQNLIDNIRFHSTLDDPQVATRDVVLVSVQDSGGIANGANDRTTVNTTSVVTINAVNDQPIASTLGLNPMFFENSSPVVLFSNTTLDLVEASQEVAQVRLRVSGIESFADEFLRIDGQDIAFNSAPVVTTLNGFNVSITSTGNTATVNISGTTGFTAAQAIALINDVKYGTVLEDFQSPTREAALLLVRDDGGTLNGGEDVDNDVHVSNVSIQPRNDAPTLTATPLNPSYAEGSTAVQVFESTAIGTVENGQLIQQFGFRVEGIQDANQEFITIDGKEYALISATHTTSANQLTVMVINSGSSSDILVSKPGFDFSTAVAEGLVDGISYRSSNNNTIDSNRVFRFLSIQDNGGTLNGGTDTLFSSLMSTVSVTATNDPPMVSSNAQNPTFAEGGPSVALFDSTSVDTIENTDQIVSLNISVSDRQNGADEQLEIDGQTVALIDDSFVTAANGYTVDVVVTGTDVDITIARLGNFMASQAEALIDGLRYQKLSDDLVGTTRTVTIESIQDSGGGTDTTSVGISSVISFDVVNDAPVLTVTELNETFTEGGIAVNAFLNASVDTVESGQSLTELVVELHNIQDNVNEALVIDGDTLAIPGVHTTTANGFMVDVAFSAPVATYTITRPTGGFTVAEANALINDLRYIHTSDDPTGPDRFVSITSVSDDGGTANGGQDTTSLSFQSTIAVVGQNDAPTFSGVALDPTFTEGDTDVNLFNVTSIDSIELSDSIQEIALEVDLLQNAADESLRIDNELISLAPGSHTTLANGYTVDVVSSGTTSQVTISTATGFLDSEAITLINDLQYAHSIDDPLGTRDIRLVSVTDTGGTAGTGVDTTILNLTSNVALVGQNDAPVVSATALNPTYTEGDSGASVFESASFDAIEASDQIQEIVISVSDLQDATSELLHIDGELIALTTAGHTTANGGFSVDVQNSGATTLISISKTGGFLESEAVALIDNLQYENSIDDPSGTRGVTLVSVTDTGGTTGTGIDTTFVNLLSTISLVGQNDAPVVSLSSLDPTFTEDGADVNVFTASNFDSIESLDQILEVVVEVSGLQDPASESLRIDGQQISLATGSDTTLANGYSVDVVNAGASSQVTISRSTGFQDSEANALLDSLQYSNSIDDPLGTRDVTLVSVTDTGGTAGAGVDTTILNLISNVALAGQNDAPVVSATALNPTYTEGDSGANVFESASFDAIEASDQIQEIVISVSDLQDATSELLHIDGELIALTTAGHTTANGGFSVDVQNSGATTLISISKTGGFLESEAVALIDNLQYENSIDDPSGTRGVTLVSVTDTGGTTGTGIDTTFVNLLSTISLVGQNDAPVVSLSSLDPTFTEDGADVNVFTASNFDSIESLDQILEVVVEVSGLQDPASESLRIDGQQISLATGSDTTLANGYSVDVVNAGASSQVTISRSTGFQDSEANALLDSLQYSNSIDDPLGTRDVTLVSVTDTGGTAGTGVDTTSLNLNSEVSLNGINDRPLLNVTPDNPNFLEGDGPVGVFSNASIDLVESADSVETIVIQITGLQNGSDEILQIDGQDISLSTGNIVTANAGFALDVAGTATDSTISITRPAGFSTADAATLINELKYLNNAVDPLGATRDITILTLRDDGGTAGGGVDSIASSINSQVTIGAVNTPPSLTSLAQNPTFTEGDSSAALFASTNVDTSEAIDLVQQVFLTVSDLQNGTDEELIVDGTAIELVSGSTTTTLGYQVDVTLNGNTADVVIGTGGGISNTDTASLIDGIDYQNLSDDPLGTNRTVRIVSITDNGGGDDTGFPAIDSVVDLVSVNDAPLVTIGASNPTLTEDSSPVSLFASATIDLVESADQVQMIGLSISGLENGAAESITIDGTELALINGNSTTSAGGFDVSILLSMGGAQADIEISRGTGFTSAEASDLITSLQYQNSSQDILGSTRVVTITELQDDGGTGNGGIDLASLAAQSTISLLEVNDEPVLTAGGLNPTFTEDAGSVSLFSATNLNLVEANDLVESIEIGFTGIVDGANEQVVIDGSQISLDGSVTTTASGYQVVTSAGPASTVTISGASGITNTDAISILSSVAYQNLGDDPTAGLRTATIQLIQDNGGTSNGGDDSLNPNIVSNISVVPVNDAPTFTTDQNNPTFIENASPVVLFQNTNLSVIESGDQVQSLRVTVAEIEDFANEFLLIDGESVSLVAGSNTTAANGYLITVTNPSGSEATLVIERASGFSSVAAEALLDSIAYENRSDDPVGPQRTITVSEVRDNGGTNAGGVDVSSSTPVSSVVMISPVNDAPVVVASASGESFTENGTAVSIFGSATVDLIEANDAVQSVELTVSGILDGANEQLTIAGTLIDLVTGTHTAANGFTVNVVTSGSDANVNITRNQVFSANDLETLLTQAQYSVAGDQVTDGQRVVTIARLQDTGGTLNSGDNDSLPAIQSAITVVGVNDSPTITDSILAPTTDNETNPPGATISSLLGPGFVDADGDSLAGVAVVSNTANPSNGVWQYSSDGINWSDIGSVSDSSALVLSSNTLVRFLPQLHFAGAPASLVVHAIDSSLPTTFSTSGTAESRVVVSTSSLAPSSAIGPDSGAITTSVSILNFAPTITDTNDTFIQDNEVAQPLASVVINDANLDLLTTRIVVSGGVTNGEFSADSLAAAGISLTAPGVYELSTPSSAAQIQAALRSLVYEPSENQVAVGATQSTTFTIEVADSLETTTDATVLNVLSVNSSPLNQNLELATIDEDVFDPAGSSVVDLVNSITDPDFGGSVIGIAVVGNDANPATEGVWQYTANGTDWISIGAVSESNALTIAADTLGQARIRFLPNANFNGTPNPLQIVTLDNTFARAFSASDGIRRTIDVTTNTSTDYVSDTVANVAINVASINDRPTFQAIATQAVTAGESFASPSSLFQAASNDVDGDILQPVLVSGPSNGSLTLNPDGSFIYVPDPDFLGIDTFQWQASDGDLLSEVETVVLEVIPVIALDVNSGPGDTIGSENESENESDSESEQELEPEEESQESAAEPRSIDRPNSSENAAPAPVLLAVNVLNVATDTADDDLIGVFFSPSLEAEAKADSEQSQKQNAKQSRGAEDEGQRSGTQFRQTGSIQSVDYALINAPGELWTELDAARESVESQLENDMLKVGTTGFAASGFTVGFVAWAIRSGFLLSSFLAQMPAWRSIDPLLIMQGGFGNMDDEETLEEMMQRESESLDNESA